MNDLSLRIIKRLTDKANLISICFDYKKYI